MRNVMLDCFLITSGLGKTDEGDFQIVNQELRGFLEFEISEDELDIISYYEIQFCVEIKNILSLIKSGAKEINLTVDMELALEEYGDKFEEELVLTLGECKNDIDAKIHKRYYNNISEIINIVSILQDCTKEIELSRELKLAKAFYEDDFEEYLKNTIYKFQRELEFENLLSLLENDDESIVNLGLELAQNYQDEFKQHFGYSLEFHNILPLLENDDKSMVNLGLKLAQNHQEEFEQYFGRSLDDYIHQDLIELLENKRISSVFLEDENEDELDELGELGFHRIFSFREIKTLRLYLSYNYYSEHWEEWRRVRIKIPANISACSNLRKLTLFDENYGIKIPIEICYIKNLEVLSCSGVITVPAEIGNLKNLINLDLKEIYFSDISVLKKLKKLTTLNLIGNNDDYFISGISDISSLKGLKKLTNLNLSCNKISDISALKGLKKLTNLNLSCNKISDISALKGLKNLTNLDLSNNEISDISALRGLKNLTSLNLTRNEISDISALRSLKNLTSLNLTRNEISDIQEEYLRKSLPNCEIYFAWY